MRNLLPQFVMIIFSFLYLLVLNWRSGALMVGGILLLALTISRSAAHTPPAVAALVREHQAGVAAVADYVIVGVVSVGVADVVALLL